TAASKPPKSLTADQVQAYQDAINAYVVDIQDKAVTLYTAGYQKAIQMQVYDDYTAKIREALGRIAADKFPPEKESRTRERAREPPPNPENIPEGARATARPTWRSSRRSRDEPDRDRDRPRLRCVRRRRQAAEDPGREDRNQ